MATIFPREEKAEYLFDKILENPQACERLMETFYESVESEANIQEKYCRRRNLQKLYLMLIRIKI